MDRNRMIEHRGRQIASFDWRDIQSEDESHEAIRLAREFMSLQPPDGKLLTLVDATNSMVWPSSLELLKQLTAHNKSRVLAGAVVGLSPMLRLTMRILALFNGRKLAVFLRRDDALDWLVAQQVRPSVVPEQYPDAA